MASESKYVFNFPKLVLVFEVEAFLSQSLNYLQATEHDCSFNMVIQEEITTADSLQAQHVHNRFNKE